MWNDRLARSPQEEFVGWVGAVVDFAAESSILRPATHRTLLAVPVGTHRVAAIHPVLLGERKQEEGLSRRHGGTEEEIEAVAEITNIGICCGLILIRADEWFAFFFLGFLAFCQKTKIP
jgi:hypothetical protein